ncbi:hypothetical protein M8C21_007419, partial [Ambrosia artemisiifolia]
REKEIHMREREREMYISRERSKRERERKRGRASYGLFILFTHITGGGVVCGLNEQLTDPKMSNCCSGAFEMRIKCEILIYEANDEKERRQSIVLKQARVILDHTHKQKKE